MAATAIVVIASEQGNVLAKLFEYFGTRRPILGIGLEDGVPATFIRDRQAGVFSNNPEVISRQLQSWINEKRENGFLKTLPKFVSDGLTRDEQYKELEEFLKNVVLREQTTRRGT